MCRNQKEPACLIQKKQNLNQTLSYLKLKRVKSLSERTPLNRHQDFFNNVFQVARLIPKGRVTSYGAIANYLGTKSSARLVGWAMNQAHAVQPKIPAHRVVNRNGMLSGKHHFDSPTQMEELLKKEKVIVVNDIIQNFKDIFWDPSIELQID